MTRPSKDIDALIREALEQEPRDGLPDIEDQSMSELLTATFRGRNRWLAAGGVLANLILLILGIVAAVNFGKAVEPRTMMLWGAAAAVCFGMVLAIKAWYWLEMVRLSLTRDVKRVELRVVQLARRLESGGDEG